ncbi:MAG: divalent-cation tolerance protein CutA [Candidatus Korarchaeota archaeon]
MSLYVIYTTVNTKEKATKLARDLIENGTAACVSFCPVRSIYRWKGEIVEDEEYLLIIKSLDPQKVEKYLKENHPYELPEIIYFRVESSDDYLNWVAQQFQ